MCSLKLKCIFYNVIENIVQYIEYTAFFGKGPPQPFLRDGWSAAHVSVKISATIKADSHVACRAHAVLLPCRATKGLEFVFAI